MTKRMRELQTQMETLKKELDTYLAEGETRDLAKAEDAMTKFEAAQKEFELEEKADKIGKAHAPEATADLAEKVDGFKVLAKAIAGKRLTDVEKTALISGTDAAQGENYLVPADVRAEINELRKQYVSAKNLVTVIRTDSLTGSVNYENGTPAGLTNFDDGDAITEETAIAFAVETFAVKHYGKLVPVSRILLGAEKAQLMDYLNRWFVKNAVLTENAQIFAALKAGYASGTPKSIAGWKALKSSINKDLDPSAKLDGVIITNQSGWDCLDSEVDRDGRPILQPNPANATEKLYQGLPVHVFPDAQLANMGTTQSPTFPMIYGSTKAGCTFVEHEALEFSVAEQYLFNYNQNCLRVIESFDVMSTDTGAYVYAAFTATPTT